MTTSPGATPEFPLRPALEFLRSLGGVNHALERLSARMTLTLGVTSQQRSIIRCLGRYPGMTAGQLAGSLHLDAGTVSAALGRLEAKGLVDRRRDPRDRRRGALGLTADGRALDRPSQGTVEAAVERLLDHTPPKDLDVTLRVLETLARNLIRAADEPTPVNPKKQPKKRRA